ncbi:nitroreductase family deazaflavin-dependent oxidoreductase [Actinacidiphila epipremni]|jgi:deazaflavin-dependent oxidoreductase (nitroreductase family)|uniref:Nitroreductase family deazaflavin-dependent oxidoreductase n=1 Tax=Actinacidiphila epipremni TaxID=2053013 RepID=A0ABX0ZQD2_9ACTN|nr:nitroreductase family deazaflavin-dependent oxidoreductase [Actinacidiphila epipremni]NJP43793.1 nitroreductase family deazaflavin-dependent oxidoreductase [Actinacidiphila epipremni]
MTDYDPANVKLSPESWVAEQATRYEESNGTEGTDMNGSPCLLLDYQGWRSGEWRRTVLIYAREGENYLIVASKGGAPEHPLWFKSLITNPEVHVRVLGERFPARAEVLTPEEKAEVWSDLLDVYPPYAEYQERTSREIPVVRLSRI